MLREIIAAAYLSLMGALNPGNFEPISLPIMVSNPTCKKLAELWDETPSCMVLPSSYEEGIKAYACPSYEEVFSMDGCPSCEEISFEFMLKKVLDRCTTRTIQSSLDEERYDQLAGVSRLRIEAAAQADPDILKWLERQTWPESYYNLVNRLGFESAQDAAREYNKAYEEYHGNDKDKSLYADAVITTESARAKRRGIQKAADELRKSAAGHRLGN